MTRVRVSIVSLFVWALLPLVFRQEGIVMLIIFSGSLLHEVGHLTAFRLCGARAQEITVLPFGISVRQTALLQLTGGQEVLCALAGPLTNFLLAAAVFLLPDAIDPLRTLIVYCNLSLAAINLLPVLPLDGGRVLYFALTGRGSVLRAERICAITGWILSAAIFLLGFWQLLTSGHNFSLLMIGGYLILSAFFGKNTI